MSQLDNPKPLSDDDSDTGRFSKSIKPDEISNDVIVVHLRNIFAAQKDQGKDIKQLLSDNLANREGLAAINRRVSTQEDLSSWSFRTALTSLFGFVITLVTSIILFLTRK